MSNQLNITPGETVEVVRDESSADVLVLNAQWAPGESAPPPHYHPNQAEHFEVRSGTLRVEVDGAQRDLRTGEALDVPRRTAHRMWNPYGESASARWETRPAGRTEEWFTAVAGLQGTKHVTSSGRPKPLAFIALADDYKDTFRLAVRPEGIVNPALGVVARIVRIIGQAPARAS
jgi:mannose-6-phosphate isomerase-like protein (cupin superfamily)